jgi:hypothetical protein
MKNGFNKIEAKLHRYGASKAGNQAQEKLVIA